MMFPTSRLSVACRCSSRQSAGSSVCLKLPLLARKHCAAGVGVGKGRRGKQLGCIQGLCRLIVLAGYPCMTCCPWQCMYIVWLSAELCKAYGACQATCGSVAGREFQRGLVLVCSQKTLSVAALLVPQVAAQPGLQLTAGGGGIAMVVCVFVYIAQLSIDFLIGAEWSKQIP